MNLREILEAIAAHPWAFFWLCVFVWVTLDNLRGLFSGRN